MRANWIAACHLTSSSSPTLRLTRVAVIAESRGAAVGAAIGPAAHDAIDVGGEERGAQHLAGGADSPVLEGLSPVGEALRPLRDAPVGDELFFGMVDPAIECLLIDDIAGGRCGRARALDHGSRLRAVATSAKREESGSKKTQTHKPAPRYALHEGIVLVVASAAGNSL